MTRQIITACLVLLAANAQAKTFNSNGLSFDHDNNWSVRATDYGVDLYPANASETESYSISVNETNIASIKDPSVTKNVDAIVKKVFVKSHRRHQMSSTPNANGSAGRLTYFVHDGKTAFIVQVFGTIINHKRILLFAQGTMDDYKVRRGNLAELFFTINHGKVDQQHNQALATIQSIPSEETTPAPAPVVNQKIVGTWRRTTSSYSGGYGDAYASASTTIILKFNADGTFTRNARTNISAGTSSSSALSNGGDGTTERGRYTVNGDKIQLKYSTGETVNNYYSVFLHYNEIDTVLALKSSPNAKASYLYKID